VEEAIRVIRLMWSHEPSARFAGRYYQLSGVRPGPVPMHPIGIWLGAYKPRMLRLVGRLADGWVPSLFGLDPDDLPGQHAIIDASAEAAGRNPASLRRILNVGENVTSDELFALATVHGFDSFILSTADRETLIRFGTEVAPALRERVQRFRAA
jgi:alkanesulfonate monooxygenase SsuD/methylene tetrahydromethanopterin reductase-like flavin-dependent oxidoreductase (luciferase family)